MALSSAERARRYRDRLKNDPDKKREYLKKERERKKKSYVPIGVQTNRSQRSRRKNWKKASQRYRDNQRNQASLITPPTTPLNPERSTAQKQRGRKKVRRDRAKCYRLIVDMKLKLSKQERLVEKWKKRYNREKATAINYSESPRSKVHRIIRDVNKTGSKKLVFNQVIVDELRKKYRKNNDKRMQRNIRKIAASAVLRKYKMMNLLSKEIGISRRLIRKDQRKGVLERKVRSGRQDDVRERIVQFFERDDNTRMMPGKKDTITRRKVKKQKRLLNDSLKTIHSKYLYEFPDSPIHYSTFCKLKPFWVIKPTIADLNTCLCKKCQNMELLHKKAVTENLVQGTLKDTLKSIVCENTSQSCMYSTCGKCCSETVKFNLANKKPRIMYEQWVTKEKEFGEGKKTKVTAKDTFFATTDDFCHKYEQELKPRYSIHSFNIYHQYKELKKLRDNVTDKEVIIHIDFSENYSCKYSEEIQSVHFGASHQQASMHTGVYYVNGISNSFSTISSCTRHDPSGIWGHLEPVLKSIKKKHPLVETIHFVSDGPTTQYRNKTNFWFASTIPRTLGFKNVYWNFLEAGHGKGAPDGIGGVLKRTADALVAQGRDIPTPVKLYEELVPATSVELFYIEEHNIEQFDSGIPELIPIVGTMKIHQVLFPNATGTVKSRILSCYCTRSACFKTTDGCLLRKPNLVRIPLADITLSSQNKIKQVNHQNAEINKWCVVSYERQPYPGIITDIDTDSIEVNTMARVGKNRFFWPMKEDKLWYFWDKIITFIPDCEKVTNRHHQIDPQIWRELEDKCTEYELDI